MSRALRSVGAWIEWVILILRLALARLCAPKAFGVFERAGVKNQQDFATQIARRILTSGHFMQSGNPRRYHAARFVARMALLLQAHGNVLEDWPEPPGSFQALRAYTQEMERMQRTDMMEMTM